MIKRAAMIPSSLLLLGLTALPPPAGAGEVQDFLKRFHADPTRGLQRLPDGVDADHRARARGYIDEQKAALQLEFRNEVRRSIMERAAPERDFTEPILHSLEINYGDNEKDNPARVVEPGPLETNLLSLESRHLLRRTLPQLPWSDSYWPTFKGGPAARYAAPSFPHSTNWLTNYNFVRANPAGAIAAHGSSTAIGQLSPTEKYDLAVGDRTFSLTNYAWRQGEKHYSRMGRIPGWFGYCHGWSAASHMLAPYPKARVDVTAPDGTVIPFYPQDIKALTSMLWANSGVATRFMGNRCDGRPRKNEFGRVTDTSCFDTNPGSWHLAIVNQLGIHQRSLVMDSSLDFQVWNYPIAGYSYRYFHPTTWAESSSAKHAALPIAAYKTDPFKSYRSPKAHYVVGVVMEVIHAGAIQPRHAGTDAPLLNTLRFIYDLELDANFTVVGGEWYSNAHPDFVWTHARDAQATASTDHLTSGDGWAASQPVPASWSEYAARAAQRGQPLQAFLRGISVGN